LASLNHVQEQPQEVKSVLTSLGQIWMAGATVDWTGFLADERRHRVPLPTYPFERKRYWIEPAKMEFSERPAPTDGPAAAPEATRRETQETPPVQEVLLGTQ